MNLKTERRKVLRSESTNRTEVGCRLQILWLFLALALTASSAASAQTYRVLKSFTGSDGAYPCAGLVLSGGTLYGTTSDGGASNCGVIFHVNTDGSSYGVLKSFTGSDGKYPYYAGLVLAGSTLYGTTSWGGPANYGVVFRVNTNGSGYAVLRTFDGYSGGGVTELVLSGTTLYWSMTLGGDYGHGGVCKINSDGSGYAMLRSFSGPVSGLVLSGNTLYGTGGDSAYGGVFKLDTDGSAYALLKDFTFDDGADPNKGMVLSGSTLYGTTWRGGTSGCGVVFKLNTDGSGFALLKNFSGSDGANPYAGLVLAGSTLYGTTTGYRDPGVGVVFKVGTDGSGFSVLKTFHGGSDGSQPYGGLVLAGSTLYGTARYGGVHERGVLFSLDVSPPSITMSPVTQTAEAGTRPCFWVQVTNTSPAATSYRWYFNATNALDGATNSYLLLTNVQPLQAGAYTVVVTNLLGAVTSAPALLSVISPVPRRPVAALTLMGQAGAYVNLDSRSAIDSSATWQTFDTVSLTNSPQSYFDLTVPLAPQRFYRAWQTNVLSPPSLRDVHLIPAITLIGTVGSSLRIDYINQFGPIDAWVTNLATVTLTNTSQLYFDTSSIGQPPRLYRLVPVP